MVQRRDGSGWTLPGGKPEPGETLINAARRELQEETGLLHPNLSYLYSGIELDGWITHCFSASAFDMNEVNLNPLPGEPPVKWGTWQELIEGPFGLYNKALNSFIRSLDEF